MYDLTLSCFGLQRAVEHAAGAVGEPGRGDPSRGQQRFGSEGSVQQPLSVGGITPFTKEFQNPIDVVGLETHLTQTSTIKSLRQLPPGGGQ